MWGFNLIYKQPAESCTLSLGRSERHNSGEPGRSGNVRHAVITGDMEEVVGALLYLKLLIFNFCLISSNFYLHSQRLTMMFQQRERRNSPGVSKSLCPFHRGCDRHSVAPHPVGQVVSLSISSGAGDCTWDRHSGFKSQRIPSACPGNMNTMYE